MYYASMDLLAILILLIENQDIIFNKRPSMKVKTWTIYRRFLFAVLAYYVTDTLWGIFEYYKLAMPLFIDTTIYFIVMAAGIVLWSTSVFYYIKANGRFGPILKVSGRTLATIITALSLINIFTPIIFTVDDACVYKALPLRHLILIAQIVFQFIISVYAFAAFAKVKDRRDKLKPRYRTVTFSDLLW